MELEILNKKVSTYRDTAGRVRHLSDDLLLELLDAWEHWTGPAKGFYTAVGVSAKGIAGVIKKAKKLRREGFPGDNFKEIKVAGTDGTQAATTPCSGIELGLTDGKVIRFPQVDQLVEFLKKAA